MYLVVDFDEKMEESLSLRFVFEKDIKHYFKYSQSLALPPIPASPAKSRRCRAVFGNLPKAFLTVTTLLEARFDERGL